MRRPRLVYVVTHPATADLLLRGQLAFMQQRGFDVTMISAPGTELERVGEREGVRTVAVPMMRAPHGRDPESFARLTMALRALRPDIVNASTPKAGLLGMLAARSLGVAVRIYLLRGLRLETARGALRLVLSASERIAGACAHDVVCVSNSLMRAAVDGGHLPSSKARVLGRGSSNGVDTDRFRRDDRLRAVGREALRPLGIGPRDPLVVFVGRFARDKGIIDLVNAFTRVRDAIPEAKLLVAGGDLADEAVDPEIVRLARSTPGVVATGRIDDVAPYYASADVLAFPSLREGFPNVPLEASSAELPVVGYRVTGVVDAIKDGETGQLIDPGDVGSLARALIGYLADSDLAAAHGRAGRRWVTDDFSRGAVWNRWLDAYTKRLAARGLPLPTAER